MAANSDSTMR